MAIGIWSDSHYSQILSLSDYNAAAGMGHYGLEVFDNGRLRVTLIEAAPRVLGALPESLAEAAHEELEKLSVTVLTNTTVTEVSRDWF